MEKHKLKFVDEMVCFQEVPDETTVSFSISNCPHKCKGCHSAYLSEDIGIPLLDVLESKLEYYFGLITCVLFLGGDDEYQIDELIKCVEICKEFGVKVALYSGAEDVPNVLWSIFDYIKVGPYVEELGALKDKTTNQRMYKKIDGVWQDITHVFWDKPLIGGSIV